MYCEWPVAMSIARLSEKLPSEDLPNCAKILHRSGATTLRKMGIMYYTVDGREELERVCGDWFFAVERFARANTFDIGFSVSVVWYDEHTDTNAAWPCTVLTLPKTPESDEIVVKCHYDNEAYVVSLTKDEVWVNPHTVATIYTLEKIPDVSGNMYYGKFTECGQLHDMNALCVPANGGEAIACSYQYGKRVA